MLLADEEDHVNSYHALIVVHMFQPGMVNFNTNTPASQALVVDRLHPAPSALIHTAAVALRIHQLQAATALMRYLTQRTRQTSPDAVSIREESYLVPRPAVGSRPWAHAMQSTAPWTHMAEPTAASAKRLAMSRLSKEAILMPRDQRSTAERYV